MATIQLPIQMPIKGIARANARESQPPETLWDAQNVLPYDRYGRKRLAQRGGLKKQYPNQMSDNFVQGMLEAPNIVYPPGILGMAFGGISDIPGYPPSFSSPGTIGPLAGPTTSVAFAGGWKWDFVMTANSTTGVVPVSLLAVFAFPTTTDMVNPYGLVLYLRVGQNGSGPQYFSEVAFYEGLLATAPVPDSTPHFPPSGTATLLAFPDVSNQTDMPSLWMFSLTLDAGGNMTLFDVTDATDSGSIPLSVVPTIVPLPSLVSATYYDASMSSDAVFNITD